MYNYIQSTGMPFMIVATKADKIAVTKVDKYVDDLRKNLNVADDVPILPFSTERKIYSEKVWKQLEEYIEI